MLWTYSILPSLTPHLLFPVLSKRYGVKFETKFCWPRYDFKIQASFRNYDARSRNFELVEKLGDELFLLTNHAKYKSDTYGNFITMGLFSVWTSSLRVYLVECFLPKEKQERCYHQRLVSFTVQSNGGERNLENGMEARTLDNFPGNHHNKCTPSVSMKIGMSSAHPRHVLVLLWNFASPVSTISRLGLPIAAPHHQIFSLRCSRFRLWTNPSGARKPCLRCRFSMVLQVSP